MCFGTNITLYNVKWVKCFSQYLKGFKWHETSYSSITSLLVKAEQFCSSRNICMVIANFCEMFHVVISKNDLDS